MKLITQIKLLPDKEQAEALKTTILAANAACNFASEQTWATRTFKQYDLHHLCYKDIRSRFGLSAQAAVQVISKVADSYKLDKRTFRPTGSIAYDDRILSWHLLDSAVSIWTTSGRIRVPFVCGPRQRELLQARKGESDLLFRKGKFYLAATCDAEAPGKIETCGALGVDLGIKNIAVDSDGVVHSSSQVNNVRHRHRRLRSRLQAKGTRSAKRKLKKLSGREARFAKDVNHRISKEIVAKAKDTLRITVPRRRRAALSSWSLRSAR